MGGGISVHDETFLNKKQNEIVRLMMPTYYTLDAVTDSDIIEAKKIMSLIFEDSAPGYIAIKSTEEGKKYFSCLVFFYEIFYNKLFELNPSTRFLFKTGFTSLGKNFSKILELLLVDPNTIKEKLTGVVEFHNGIGVRAIEFGIAGDCLLSALGVVLGRELYTEQARFLWERLFSRLLSVIIPIAVSCELKTDGVGQKKRAEEDRLRREKNGPITFKLDAITGSVI